MKAFAGILKKENVKFVYFLSLNEKLFLSRYAHKRGAGVTWVEHQEMRSWMTKNPWRWLYKRNAEFSKVAPICRKNANILQKDIGLEKQSIVEIINGVDVKGIQKGHRDTEKGFVLMANRFIPKKGVLDFVEALKILDQDKPEISRAEILGEGEEKTRILESLNDIKNIPATAHDFLKKEKWYEALHKADVFVISSRDQNETFSLSAAEALAAGCKLVITNCCGIADYLEDGKDAFLVKPKNPKSLADGMLKALAATDNMRNKAQETARNKFDQSRMLREYYQLITRDV